MRVKNTSVKNIRVKKHSYRFFQFLRQIFCIFNTNCFNRIFQNLSNSHNCEKRGKNMKTEIIKI